MLRRWIKIFFFIGAFFWALTFGLLIARCAHGAEPLSTAMARLPTYFEDRADPELKAVHTQDLARAIEQASTKPPGGLSPKDWQALLVAVGYWESTFSIRIHKGDCRPKECDAGRARSPWQMHRSVFTAPVWDQMFGIEHVDLQAQTASDMLKRSYWTCARSGMPWLAGTLNAYAGRRCTDVSWGGLGDREQTFMRIRSRL